MKPSLQIKIQESKSGHPVCIVNDVRVHSSYNPVKEAERFISSNENGKLYIILFPCGDFLSDAIRTQDPQAKIISFNYAEPASFSASQNALDWYPQKGSIRNFLFQHIHEWELSELVVLKWQNGAAAYKDAAVPIEQDILDTIKAIHASAATSSHFYYKWLRNSFINTQKQAVDLRLNKPVLLAASGPGLESSIDEIFAHRESFFITALPSSIPFLQHHNISIDAIFASDPGYWAIRHFDTAEQTIPVIAPLTAALDDRPFIPFSHGSCIENYFTKQDIITIPSQGTVAASALRFFSQFQTVFLTGLDLKCYDLKSHAQPHSFDSIIASMAHRTDPELSVRYKRLGADILKRQGRFIQSPSLEKYYTYFKQASYPNVFTIDNKNDLFPYCSIKEASRQNVENVHIKPSLLFQPSKAYKKIKHDIITKRPETLWSFAPREMLQKKDSQYIVEKALSLLEKLYESSGA